MNTAIITGGSRGFGRALAADLVADGWDVVLDGRHADDLLTAAGAMGPRAHPVVGDVTDPAHRDELLAVAAELGPLDLLVNNAGSLGPSPLPLLADLSLADLESVLRANVVAPLGLVQSALPRLRRSAGAVINVTSDAAVEAYPGWGAYGSSKAAFEQVSHVLAAEEAGVSVWWFDPGDMRTDMHQAAFPGDDISDRPDPSEIVPAIRRLLTARPPSGRVRAVDLLGTVAP